MVNLISPLQDFLYVSFVKLEHLIQKCYTFAIAEEKVNSWIQNKKFQNSPFVK